MRYCRRSPAGLSTLIAAISFKCLLSSKQFEAPAQARRCRRLTAGGNGLGRWTFCRLLALVAPASRDGSRSDPELGAALPIHRSGQKGLAKRSRIAFASRKKGFGT